MGQDACPQADFIGARPYFKAAIGSMRLARRAGIMSGGAEQKSPQKIAGRE